MLRRVTPLLAFLLLLAGCATVPSHPPVPVTGDPLVDGNANLAVAPAKDRVLWQYRIASAALRRDRPDEAKAKLDDALAAAAANYGQVNSQAAKSRRLFRNESDKPFVGEPYERAMANYYRGILYWRDGEPDNARATFRSAQLLDSDSEDKTYAGDYVLFDYLEGLASLKLGGDGAGGLARARANARQQRRPAPPDYDRDANVLLFVEYGHGPTKYTGGEYGEQLKFLVRQSKVRAARLRVDGDSVELPPYDDLNFQATTRGGRVMDHILGNKAVFKGASDTVGDVALVGALEVARHGRGEDAGAAALGLAAFGALAKVASAATTPQADIRCWDTLPQYLSFAALRLPPGDHEALLEFLDEHGQPVGGLTQRFTLTVPPADASVGYRAQDTVVFRSQMRQ